MFRDEIVRTQWNYTSVKCQVLQVKKSWMLKTNTTTKHYNRREKSSATRHVSSLCVRVVASVISLYWATLASNGQHYCYDCAKPTLCPRHHKLPWFPCRLTPLPDSEHVQYGPKNMKTLRLKKKFSTLIFFCALSSIVISWSHFHLKKCITVNVIHILVTAIRPFHCR